MKKQIEVETNTGVKFLVDLEDLHVVGDHKWHIAGPGYIGRRCKWSRKTIYLHREIMSNPKGVEIDHINKDKKDNRKSNLRKANRKENSRNAIKWQVPTSSPYKGVSRRTGYNKWRSYIRVDDKQIHLGYYDIAVEAALVYDKAAIKYFGKFAGLNFPNGAR